MKHAGASTLGLAQRQIQDAIEREPDLAKEIPLQLSGGLELRGAIQIRQIC